MEKEQTPLLTPIPFSAEMAVASTEKNQLDSILKRIELSASVGNTSILHYDKMLPSSKEGLEKLGYTVETRNPKYHIMSW